MLIFLFSLTVLRTSLDDFVLAVSVMFVVLSGAMVISDFFVVSGVFSNFRSVGNHYGWGSKLHRENFARGDTFARWDTFAW